MHLFKKIPSATQNSNYFTLDETVVELCKKRPKQSHKGNYGHALIMAGSYGKIGAAVLSSKACLRSGAGLLTTLVPKCGYTILQSSIPEAMCITDKEEEHLSQLPDLSSYNTVGIGPGIGKEKVTAELLKQILKECTIPLVLDADAINLLSENPELQGLLPEGSILTPHIKEFDRLCGPSKTSLERLDKQKAFSKKHKCIVVLKNANTTISSTDESLYFNTSGNPGMATAGSGDVLTGIITGLLAQQYKPLDAAIIGVYYHGVAGDAAAKDKGFSALIASDIIEYLKIPS